MHESGATRRCVDQERRRQGCCRLLHVSSNVAAAMSRWEMDWSCVKLQWQFAFRLFAHFDALRQLIYFYWCQKRDTLIRKHLKLPFSLQLISTVISNSQSYLDLVLRKSYVSYVMHTKTVVNVAISLLSAFPCLSRTKNTCMIGLWKTLNCSSSITWLALSQGTKLMWLRKRTSTSVRLDREWFPFPTAWRNFAILKTQMLYDSTWRASVIDNVRGSTRKKSRVPMHINNSLCVISLRHSYLSASILTSDEKWRRQLVRININQLLDAFIKNAVNFDR